MMVLKLQMVLFLICLETVSLTHYLVNGGFQIPALPSGTYSTLNSTLGWSGRFQIVNIQTYTDGLAMGQYLDLQINTGPGQDGFITQAMSISSDENSCTLRFFQKAMTTFFSYHVTEIYWNQKFITTQIAVTTDVTYHEIKLNPVSGLNTLTFKQVGEDRYQPNGLFFDNIQLSCEYIPLIDYDSSNSALVSVSRNKDIILLLSVLFSLPVHSIFCFKFFYFFTDDLWLYDYDNRNYSPTIQSIFNFATAVQNGKMQSINIFFKLSQFRNESRYKKYSNQKFVKIQDSSQILFDSSFYFFIYTMPMNIVICTLLYLIYLLLKKCKAEKYFRKFYFFKIYLFRDLILDNLAYFIFVCFKYYLVSFSFNFIDRASLSLATFFLFTLISASFIFYWIIRPTLKKKTKYFFQSIINNGPGYIYLTINKNIVKVLRGVFHTFLFYNPLIQITCNGCLKFFSFGFAIFMQINYRVYKIKSQFALQAFYFLLLFFLDITILCYHQFSHNPSVQLVYIEQGQQILVYLLSFIVIARTFAQFSEKKPKKKHKKSQKVEKLLVNSPVMQTVAHLIYKNTDVKLKKNKMIVTQLDKTQQRSSIIEEALHSISYSTPHRIDKNKKKKKYKQKKSHEKNGKINAQHIIQFMQNY